MKMNSRHCTISVCWAIVVRYLPARDKIVADSLMEMEFVSWQIRCWVDDWNVNSFVLFYKNHSCEARKIILSENWIFSYENSRKIPLKIERVSSSTAMGDVSHLLLSLSTRHEFNHLIIAQCSPWFCGSIVTTRIAQDKRSENGIFVRKSITNTDSVLIIFIYLIWMRVCVVFASQLIGFALLTTRCRTHTAFHRWFFVVVLSFNLFSYLSFFGLRWKAWNSLVEQICDGKHGSVVRCDGERARRTEKYTSKLKININYSDWMAVSRRSWPNNKLRGETSIRDRAARTWIEFNRLVRDGLTQSHSQLKCLRKMPDTASLWDFVQGFARCRHWCVHRRPNKKRKKN